jgi:hypothetical protein
MNELKRYLRGILFILTGVFIVSMILYVVSVMVGS